MQSVVIFKMFQIKYGILFIIIIIIIIIISINSIIIISITILKISGASPSEKKLFTNYIRNHKALCHVKQEKILLREATNS